MEIRDKRNHLKLKIDKPSLFVTIRALMERHHYRFDRITLDPEKCFGKACIRGMRMPVESILVYLASGMTIDEILKEWPELEREDILQALEYASWAMSERVLELVESPLSAQV